MQICSVPTHDKQTGTTGFSRVLWGMGTVCCSWAPAFAKMSGTDPRLVPQALGSPSSVIVLSGSKHCGFTRISHCWLIFSHSLGENPGNTSSEMADDPGHTAVH